MNERQLIILQQIVIQVIYQSRLNSDKNCFEQRGPLDIPMELAEYSELKPIKNYLDDLLAVIPGVAD